MTNIFIAIISYFIDKRFGEFRFIKHPIISIGEMIDFFEERFYKNSVARGGLLVLFVLSIITFFSIAVSMYLEFLPLVLNIIVSSIIASIFIAHNMLHASVKSILTADDKKAEIAKLVSRDTQDMSESDIYKASIETYAENLSDGVVAPVFYLLLFGLPGIVIYKAINTMDSMVGYRNERYEMYGKIPAILDDIVNYIPSRITAVLIMLSSFSSIKKYGIFGFYKDGSKHDSPNAGHPITAVALVFGLKLGGDTSYFGKVKEKAHFGVGKEIITQGDVKNVLRILV